VLSHHHEIPTHLNVEDKLVFGLTARQFLYLLIACSLAFAFWEQAVNAPAAARIAVCVACLLAGATVALVRPLGRGVEVWLLVAVLFTCRPRRAVWRSLEPDAADWRPVLAGWQELAPSVTWVEEERA
jgi:hypothetical protein